MSYRQVYGLTRLRLIVLGICMKVFVVDSLGQRLEASDLQWQTIFGTRRVSDAGSDSTVTWQSRMGGVASSADTIYCLLGRGFFLAERSDDVDSLISGWITEHPEARVIPVAVTGPVMIDEPGSRQVYCWLVDGEQNLNELIVRAGGYPGGTMVRPETWDELPQWEKDLFPEEEGGNGAIVLVDKVAYDAFIERIKQAEREAQELNRGVWKDGKFDR